MSFYLTKYGACLWQGRFSGFEVPGLLHAVSTRFGGVSKQPFSSMNLALHTGDDAEAVLKNRKIFCQALGVSAERICTPEQVHGDRIFRVTQKDAGRGSRVYSDAISGTDALITNEKNIPLMLCFADCTPILLFDPVHAAIGIAHGGWRGTVQKIAQKTLLAMGQAFGSRAEQCIADIGPSIGPCCYVVGQEVAEAFAKAFPQQQEQILQSCSGQIHLNLWMANRLQLEEIGMVSERIECADTCTACNSGLFFSYRAEGGTTGRIAAVLSLV